MFQTIKALILMNTMNMSTTNYKKQLRELTKKIQDQYQMAVKSTLKEVTSGAQEVGSQVNNLLTKT